MAFVKTNEQEAFNALLQLRVCAVAHWNVSKNKEFVIFCVRRFVTSFNISFYKIVSTVQSPF